MNRQWCKAVAKLVGRYHGELSNPEVLEGEILDLMDELVDECVSESENALADLK